MRVLSSRVPSKRVRIRRPTRGSSSIGTAPTRDPNQPYILRALRKLCCGVHGTSCSVWPGGVVSRRAIPSIERIRERVDSRTRFRCDGPLSPEQ